MAGWWMECVRACVRACVRVTSRFEQVIAASLECAQQEDGSAYSLSSMQVTSLPAQTRRPKRQCCGQSIVPATEWAVCALQDHAGAVAVLKLCRANAVLLVPQFADLQSAARLGSALSQCWTTSDHRCCCDARPRSMRGIR